MVGFIKKLMSCLVMLLVFQAYVSPAFAEEAKITGNVVKIEMTSDSKSATVTVEDGTSGEKVQILVEDEETLEKLKDKRISVGDEIRSKYEKSDKNKSRLFKKTAGC